MHRCLTVQEILSIIFNYISGYQDSRTSSNVKPSQKTHATLAHLAVTCKAFHEPAITSLWSYQTSLIPLVHCLPSDAYVEIDKNLDLTLELLRDPSPLEFDRIRFYAQKIKNLDVIRATVQGTGRQLKLSPQALALLLLHKPESVPLLPNLHHLALNGIAFEGAAAFPRLVIGQHLKSVHIQSYPFYIGRAWDNVTTTLSPYASTLKSFTVDCFDNDALLEPLNPHITQLYSNFHDLNHLRTRGIELNNKTILCVSTLPMLQKLDLRLFGLDLNSLPQLSFHLLTHLMLVARDLIDVAMFLSSTSFKVLHTISVERDGLITDDLDWDCQIFSDALHNYHQECRLISITLLCAVECPVERDGSIILTRTNIQPLFAFPHISTFAINSCTPIELDDAFLIEVSRAWPNLRDLRLRDYSFNITPGGVVSFARSCPNLENLMLGFNASAIPKYSAFNALSSTPSHLKRIDVCTSFIEVEDIDDVVQFLILAFPKLQELNYDGSRCKEGCVCEPDVAWGMVASSLKEVISRRQRR